MTVASREEILELADETYRLAQDAIQKAKACEANGEHEAARAYRSVHRVERIHFTALTTLAALATVHCIRI